MNLLAQDAVAAAKPATTSTEAYFWLCQLDQIVHSSWLVGWSAREDDEPQAANESETAEPDSGQRSGGPLSSGSRRDKTAPALPATAAARSDVT